MNMTAFLYYKVLHGLLQITTGHHIKGRWDYHKLREVSLLQIATVLLLQNATRFIKNCDMSFPKHDDYYKLRQSEQGPVECTAPSHLSQSWSHLVGQSSSNNHYISLALKKAEKKVYEETMNSIDASFRSISQKLFENKQSDSQYGAVCINYWYLLSLG